MKKFKCFVLENIKYIVYTIYYIVYIVSYIIMSSQNNITYEKSYLILLILDFLKEEGFEKSLVSLEMESNLSLFSYPKEVLFLRGLILEGQWKSAEEFLSPLEEVIQQNKYKECQFLIKKQLFMETIESDKSEIEELVGMLTELSNLGVKEEEFKSLVNCLSLDNIQDDVQFQNWSILGGRLKCFEEIRENLKLAFPEISSERRLPKGCFLTVFKEINQERLVEDDIKERDLGERILKNEKLSQSLRESRLTEMFKKAKGSNIETKLTLDKNDNKFDFEMEEEINFNDRVEEEDTVKTKDLLKDYLQENELQLKDLDKEEYFLNSPYEIFNFSIYNMFPKVRITDSKPIRTSAFSPQRGDYLVIGTNTSSLKIFDIRSITSRFNKVNKYKYTSDNLSQSIYKDIKQVKEFERHHNGSIYSVDWSCSGRLIATGSNDQIVKCLVVPQLEGEVEEEDKLELSMEGHKGIVRSVCFDPTEELILMSCGQKESIIRVWDPEEGKVKSILEGHSSDLNILKWSNDNQMVGSAGDDRTIRFWDVKINKFVSMLSCLKYDIINDISIYTRNKSISNTIIAVGHDNGVVSIWNYNNKSLIRELKPFSSKVRTVCFSGDGKYLSVGGSDSHIIIYDTEEYNIIHKLKHDNHVVSLKWHSEVPILVSTSADNSCIIWTDEE